MGKHDRPCIAIPIFIVVSEVTLTMNYNDWWVDTGDTRHSCSEKILFAEYKKCVHDEQLFIGNSAISKVNIKGRVILNEVLHILDIRKNLICGLILSKKGF